MPRVIFTANLLRHVDCPPTDVEAGTVAAALQAVFDLRPQVRDYVLDEHGQVRQHVFVFVDGVRLKDRRLPDDPVRASSQIHVLQALTGG